MKSSLILTYVLARSVIYRRLTLHVISACDGAGTNREWASTYYDELNNYNSYDNNNSVLGKRSMRIVVLLLSVVVVMIAVVMAMVAFFGPALRPLHPLASTFVFPPLLTPSLSTLFFPTTSLYYFRRLLRRHALWLIRRARPRTSLITPGRYDLIFWKFEFEKNYEDIQTA